jgi:hypothetical protein
MSRFSRTFFVWFVALVGLAVYANLPRNGGYLKWFWQWAGHPWTFAFWDQSEMKWFDAGALAADIAVWFCVAGVGAWLCAWSRCRHVNRPEPGPPM